MWCVVKRFRIVFVASAFCAKQKATGIVEEAVGQQVGFLSIHAIAEGVGRKAYPFFIYFIINLRYNYIYNAIKDF